MVTKDEPILLANAYRSCLLIAQANRLKTIAFPSISTGIYHFPKQLAAEIALEVVVGFLANPSTIKLVTFVCFDDENFGIYDTLLAKLPA